MGAQHQRQLRRALRPASATTTGPPGACGLQGRLRAPLDACSAADVPELRSDGGVELDQPPFAATEGVIAENVPSLAAGTANCYFRIGEEERLARLELHQRRILGGNQPQAEIFSRARLQPCICVAVSEAANEHAVTSCWFSCIDHHFKEQKSGCGSATV